MIHTPTHRESHILTLTPSMAGSPKTCLLPLVGCSRGQAAQCVCVSHACRWPLHVQWRLNSQLLGKSSPPRGGRIRLGPFSELFLAGSYLRVSRTRKPVLSACPVAKVLQGSGAGEGDCNELWLEPQGPGRMTASPVFPGGCEIGSGASSLHTIRSPLAWPSP